MTEKKYTRGFPRYIDIMRSLTRSPKTTLALVEDLGISCRKQTGDILRKFWHAGLIRVGKWEPATERTYAAVWTASPGFDAPIPLTVNGKRACNLSEKRPRLETSIVAFALIWDSLDGGRKSIAELEELTGLSNDTVRGIINQMHNAPRLCYVSRWNRREGAYGSPTPFYSLGNAKDVDRPNRLTDAVLNERRRIVKRMDKIRQTTKETYDRTDTCPA